MHLVKVKLPTVYKRLMKGIAMETMSSSGLELSNLTKESFQSTIDKISLGVSSILSLTRQWKQVENHYGSFGKSID